ncbi:hypothetical protein [Achromobacter sp. UMC71]|uniref:hypothetical protein n=1 Tax=Achromobacter sp. UMC71 TaxID=1862320 RepID=UPI0015FEF784|nr:hypothetical protein [Achromobacter sp. UMC71]MBB1624271.1 hypothetical protein [Achromobacter sp. UMC71]
MQIESRWLFPCEPQHIWPHFLHARMDDTRPLLFRLGVPKPISCKVLEGVAAVGNTRQCTTDRGTIDQRILILQPNARLRYQMQKSTVWCAGWVGTLVDTFELRAIPGQGTEVRRTTQFEAAGALRWAKQLGLWAGLRQAHAYASRNWRRLALQAQAKEAQNPAEAMPGASQARG